MEGLVCESRTKSWFTKKKLAAHCGASHSCLVTFPFHDFVIIKSHQTRVHACNNVVSLCMCVLSVTDGYGNM